MTWSMLKSKKMPKEFLAKAVHCAIYLSNCSANQTVRNKTPKQYWNGKQSDISHLRVFGSIAYTHVSDKKQSKLDKKRGKYIFIGYDSSSKGYKIHNLNNDHQYY